MAIEWRKGGNCVLLLVPHTSLLIYDLSESFNCKNGQDIDGIFLVNKFFNNNDLFNRSGFASESDGNGNVLLSCGTEKGKHKCKNHRTAGKEIKKYKGSWVERC